MYVPKRYYYDALNRRKEKDVEINGGEEGNQRTQTEYYWYNDQVRYERITRQEPAGEERKQAVNMWGIRGLISRGENNYTEDGHGNVDGVYSEGGEKIKEYNYDAYGNEIEQNPSDTNPYRYCSENYDTETGLIYLRARYYDPELGRFLTEDPAQDGLNWYVYCGNNPVNFVDPSGESFLANWNELKAGISKYGADATNKSKILADSAKNMALKYADDVGYYKTIREFWGPTYGYHHRKEYDTWDNPVDAMRHMEWNSMMTREIGLNQAKFYADNHEYFNLNENKWIISGNGNDNIIYTKMNQPTLMDLWNNKVGRTLASDSNLANLNYNQLFDYAVDHNLLILDANTTYEFYGVLNYVNPVDWTVTVEWNQVNDNLTFKKEGLPNLTLKVGI